MAALKWNMGRSLEREQVESVMKRTVAAANLLLIASSCFGGPLDRSGVQWSFLDWSVTNATYSGEPFDLVATATFVHDPSGERRTTEMFYDGGDTWRFRFTATRAGTWNVTTSSADTDLDGLSGTVTIAPDASAPGFVIAQGDKWSRQGTGKAFVPQFVMYHEDPNVYRDNPTRLDAEIDTFVVEHGFTGFHVPVLCTWFDIDQESCNNVSGAPRPDRRTFEALELLITRVYDRGGVVHLWVWGDEQRGMTPKRWGALNGPDDQRLQRYIAARLGPLPG